MIPSRKIFSVALLVVLIGGWTASAAAANIMTVSIGGQTLFSGSNPIQVYYNSKPVVISPTPKPPTTPVVTATPTPTGNYAGSTITIVNNSDVNSLTALEQQMVTLVNQERSKQGLKALVVDMRLVKAARMKSQDMITKNYVGHISPTYGSPFDMMKSMGITYQAAGENLAGAGTVERAHANLMNSPGHRANILYPNYTKIGIGIIQGGPYGLMITQMFFG